MNECSESRMRHRNMCKLALHELTKFLHWDESPREIQKYDSYKSTVIHA